MPATRAQLDAEPLSPKSAQALPAHPIVMAAADQINPALAFSLAAHKFLVVWEDTTNGSSLSDIRGRLVDTGGNAQGSAFPIAAGTRARHRPRVVYNANAGEFLVVYEYDYSAGDTDIFAQRVRSDGSLAGSEIIVADSPGKETRPAAAHNTAGNQYLVVWQSWVGDVEFGNNDIHGRILAASGAPVGSEITVKSADYDQDSPRVAYFTSLGQYSAIWVDHATPQYPRIYEQRLDSSGANVGAEINSTGFGANYNPNMAYSPAENEYAFVFENKAYGPPDHMTGYVYLEELGTGGFGGPIDYPPAFDEYKPDIAYNAGARNYAIVWEIAYSGDDHDVYMELYGKFSKYYCCWRIGPSVVSNLSTWEGNPAVASNDGVVSLVVWEDNRNKYAGNGMDIYGAVIFHQRTYLPLVRR